MEQDNTDKAKKPYLPIPKDLLHDERLTDSEFRYYAIIVELSYTRGYCFMSNRQLGEQLGKSIRTIQRIIDGLKEKGYVQVCVYTDDEGHIQRKITPIHHAKIVMGHAIFGTGNDMDGMTPMPDLARPPCQKWQQSKNKMSKNKMSKDTCANANLRKRTSSQSTDPKKAEQAAREELFAKFWKAYPKKKDKKKAKRAFFKIKNIEKIFPVMMQALERQKESAQWQENKGQYILYPSTWLNGERWEDVEQVEVKQPQAALPKVTEMTPESRRAEEERQRRILQALRANEQ